MNERTRSEFSLRSFLIPAAMSEMMHVLIEAFLFTGRRANFFPRWSSWSMGAGMSWLDRFITAGANWLCDGGLTLRVGG